MIEAWKVKRIVRGGCIWRYGLPWAQAGAGSTIGADGIADAEVVSDGEKLTREIDAIGMYWLTVCAYPIVGAWGLYSLLYYPQKSWWSWLVNTLANGVYSFGFVMMTPQLFINYKLKSVVSICGMICISKHAQKLSV